MLPVPADLARSWLVDLGHDRLADHVAALVRSTAAHEPPAGDRAAAVVNDVDLAICAAEPHEYERYVDAIRAEYAWLDDRSFADGRARVLESLLARPRLYHTPELAPILEPRARHNLTTELAALGGDGGRDLDLDPDR